MVTHQCTFLPAEHGGSCLQRGLHAIWNKGRGADTVRIMQIERFYYSLPFS